MKSNNNNSTTRLLDHLTRFAHGRFLILLALTAVFIFLPVSVSKSSGGEAEDEYHGFYVVSSYKNFDDAETLVDSLKAQGYDPFWKTVNIPKKGKRRRVFIKQYEDREEALLAGKGLRERGVIKSFFLLLKAGPKDKRIAPRGNADKEDNKKTPPPSTLTKIKIPAAPPVPDSTKEKTDPPKTKEVVVPSHKTDEVKFYKITYDTDIEAAPPHKTTDIDLKVDGSPYDSAMSDFASGKYEDALSKFKEMPESGKNETALRRMADCSWFLGEEKGDKRYFLEAVDRYRNIIRNYPDSGKENMSAVYRLAGSYSRLNLHYEALMEFKNVCSKYPESDYVPKALYMMGKTYYKTKKFDEAIGKFKEYIERFPDGKHIRTAYFSVGDCYSRMRRFNDADVWYDDALERWPALEDIPEDILSNLGSHYFKVGKHDDVLKVFFVYLNLFPDGKHSRTALYIIARSFEEAGRLPLALKTLSLVVERYPGTREAQRSALTMANIGVSYPKIKLPAHIFSEMNYYGAPIEAYDKMAGSLSDLAMAEELIFRKGDALTKRGRHREAFDNYRLLLNKFPYGTYKKTGEKKLILSAGCLIDNYYSKKDYLAVSEVYFNFDRKVLFGNGNFDMLFKIGTSLKKTGLPDHAAGFFEEMITVFEKDKRIKELFLAAAKVDYGEGHYETAKKRLKGLLKRKSGADKKTLAAAGKLMGDISCKEGLFKEAAGFYSEVLYSKAGSKDQMSNVRKKYADSLRGMGLYSSALINYKRVLKNCGDDAQKCSGPVIMGSYEGWGDCLYSEGKYQQAIVMYEQSLKSASEDNPSMWAIFNMGRGYANLENLPMADKSFGSLKKESGNDFWPRVMEYYTVDKNWTMNMKHILGNWGIKDSPPAPPRPLNS